MNDAIKYYAEKYGVPMDENWHLKHNVEQFAIAIWNHQQAQIDELMIEFCPEAMSDEQWEEWKKHQRVVRDHRV